MEEFAISKNHIVSRNNIIFGLLRNIVLKVLFLLKKIFIKLLI